MATDFHSPDQFDLTASRRELILACQNSSSPRFSRIVQIDALPGGRAFHCLPGAARIDGPFPLDKFLSFEGVYVADEVPAFFANHILSTYHRDITLSPHTRPERPAPT
ncbi:MAG TPA: hypothetical protein DIW46_00790 [Microbacterium sp.]|nr:hypothetical protein [Microbacterium sp.]